MKRTCNLPVNSTRHQKQHIISSTVSLCDSLSWEVCTVISSEFHRDVDWTCPAAETAALINKENICLGREGWFVTYSPSSDSLSESWLMMSFLCSSACSRAAWSFRGNSEASSSICKQPKTLQSPAINNSVWRISFKGSDLHQRTACFTAQFKARPCNFRKNTIFLFRIHKQKNANSIHSGGFLLEPYLVWYDQKHMMAKVC